MTVYKDREVERHSIPLPMTLSLANTSKIIVEFIPGSSVDIGSWCYLQRSSNKRETGKGRKVILASLCKQRTSDVAKMLSSITEKGCAFLSAQSLHNYYTYFDRFLRWCDTNNRSSVLLSVGDAREALREYVLELRRMITAGMIRNQTGHALQTAVIRILQDHHGVYDLDRGINLLVDSARFKLGTPVPSDEAVGRLVGFCTHLFSGMANLTLNFEPYPYALKMPAFLKWPNDAVWIYPGRRWRVTPEETLSTKRGSHNLSIDYSAGRVRQLDEIVSSYSSRYAAMNAISVAHSRIASANESPVNEDRLRAANIAAQSFFIIFIAATGMNLSQACRLVWNEEMENSARNPTTERKHFRAVKYRANGKVVTFTIGLRFIPLLQRYLQLRKWILQGRDFDYLFPYFHESHNYPISRLSPSEMPPKGVHYLLDIIEHMTSQVHRVTPRQLRSAKQDFLIRHFDPVTSAALMQHSLTTTIKAYSRGSETLAQNEIGDYLMRVEETVLNKGDNPPGSAERSVGLCLEENRPMSIMENPPANPNCKDQEGCLYCDKYRVHADETDVRKLLSLHYCLRQTAHFASNAEEHDAVFGHILRRIESLLAQIKARSASMERTIQTIRREVDEEGILDVYWAAKLDFLLQVSDAVGA